MLPPDMPPACEVCGRQDETLRLVAYPYVISLLVVTFRRNFAGLWCWRHRMIYLGLAGAITAALGWFGIPFGLLYTPVALWTLARGGELPVDANIDLMKRLTRLKLDIGEIQLARQIVEEALSIEDDTQTRQVVQELYRRTSLSLIDRPEYEPLYFVAALLGAIGLGMMVGLIDTFITMLIVLLLPVEMPLIPALLTWGPFIALLFLAGLILKEGVHFLLKVTQTTQQVFGLILAGLMALMMSYGILQGTMLVEYLKAIISGIEFTSFGDFLLTSLAVGTQGGFWVIGETFQGGIVADFIYFFSMIGATGLYIWLALSEANASMDWLRILEEIRAAVGLEEQPITRRNWVAIGSVVLVILFFTGISFAADPILRTDPEAQAAYDRGNELFMEGDLEGAAAAFDQAIEFEPKEASPRASLGWVLYYMGDDEGALLAFQEAVELDDEYADPHLGMGYVYFSLGERENAGAAFEAALTLDSDPITNGEALYGLANLQMTDGNLDEAIRLYENAVGQDWELIMAHMDLSLAYRYRGELDKAIDSANNLLALDPNWGAPHANLAAIYHQQDRYDQMERELGWAEDLASDDLYSVFLLADNYWLQHDFARAEAYLEGFRELYPDNEQLLLYLSALAIAQGQTEKAHALVDEAEANFGKTGLGLAARAAVHIEEQQLDRAMEALLEAKGLEPEEERIHTTISFVQFHQNHIPEAIEAAQEAIRLYPYDASSFTNLAFGLRAQGNRELALEHALRAVQLAPKSDLAHFILGVLYIDGGDAGRGGEELQTFLDLTYERAYVNEYIDQAIAYLATLPGGSP